MTMGQAMTGLLVLVWVCGCLYWGIDHAVTRYQRRLVRTRPQFPPLELERSQQLHAIVKGTSVRAGYQQGRDWR